MDQQQATPTLSVCIPAYNAAPLLRNCLESLYRQSFRDFEVIITDDSTNNQTENLAKELSSRLPIRYYHHEKPLGSPANWNSALDKATGRLVMVLHQDDWLSSPDSLALFVDAFSGQPDVDFVFGKIEPEERPERVARFPALIARLGNRPEIILMQNIIGPPSNVMFRNQADQRFDEQLIWVVDYELYYRWLKEGKKYKYIEKKLVEIGRHEEQITSKLEKHPDLKLKEEFYLLRKYENKTALSMVLYDHYWRGIRNTRRVMGDGVCETLVRTSPLPIVQLWKAQKKWSPAILKKGALSKLLMIFSWLGHKLKH